jgi:hypothetical protein
MSPLEDAWMLGACYVRADTPMENGVLSRAALAFQRMRRTTKRISHGEYEQMQTNEYVNARPARDVRLIEGAGAVHPCPPPHRAPVLPRGWAPLTTEQQEAVLQACDAAQDRVVFRLGSLWDANADYRVYALEQETWGGLWVAVRHEDRGVVQRALLGLGSNAPHAVRIALDFFNWDLEASGEPWRLAVNTPAVPPADPRRV